MNDKISSFLPVYIKGILMGVCDIIPGVSGGTMALITGIYERLIKAVGNIGPDILITFLKRDWDGFLEELKRIDLLFLIVLAAGIGTSFILMSNIILILLNDYSAETYSFFLGLIAASAVVIYAGSGPVSVRTVSGLIAGIIIGLIVSGLSAVDPGHSLPVLFITGAFAICAMVLPGISGAYITMIMNQYEYMLHAIKTLSVIDIAAYMGGAVIGILLFTKALKYLISHYHALMLAVLTGFMLGSSRMLYGRIVEDGGFDGGIYLFLILGIFVIALIEFIRRRCGSGCLEN